MRLVVPVPTATKKKNGATSARSIGALVGGAWAGSVAGVGVPRFSVQRLDRGRCRCTDVSRCGRCGPDWNAGLAMPTKCSFIGSSHSAVLLSCPVALHWPAAISLRMRGPRLVAPNVPCPATASLVEDH